MAFVFPSQQSKTSTTSQTKTPAPTGGFVFPSQQGKGTTTKKKTNLKTAIGLLQTAQQEGLQKEAAKVGGMGEQPKKLFSGGPIMDIFDTLNALQYGVVGLIKGKGFMEGVKTRQSFSDKDALGQYGIPGTIAGIALDIAVDPLTWIAPFTILKKIPGAVKAGKAVSESVKATKLGQFFGSKLVYRFGQDPIYAQMAERTTKNIAIGNQNLMEIVKPLTKLDIEAQRVIGAARKAGTLSQLTPEILAKAKPAFDELDKLGKEAVRVGLLDPETYTKNLGIYMARLYRKHEIPDTGIVKQIFDSKPMRVNLDRFMKRTDIPDDVRVAMGEIMEAGYPTAKALVQLHSAIERTKFFTEVAKKWGKDVVEEGLIKLPNTSRLGILSGKAVPKAIFDDIQEIIRPQPTGLLPKIVAGFKFGKVIMNPATHSRNIISNFILNNFEGLNPVRVDIYAEAGANLLKKGKWYQEAKSVGLGLDTYASREIKDILVGPEGGKWYQRVGRGFVDKLSNIYQKEEEFAKLAQFIYQRKGGKTAEEAWKIAERATFNYAQVTPFIRRLRESVFGYPFVTFTYKATPAVGRILLTKPTKLSNLGKIKQAIENLSPSEDLEAERAVEPDYIRNGLFVRLPNKDKYGRAGYFDLTYIIPMGDIFSGQFIQQEKEGETLQQSALRKLPFFSIISDLAQNKDFFGNDIVKGNSVEPWQQGGDIMRYLFKSYGPPVVADLPARFKSSLEFELTKKEEPLEKQKRTTRTVAQEAMRGLFGLKITPFNITREQQKRENELKARLEKLLEAEGIIYKFEIPARTK